MVHNEGTRGFKKYVVKFVKHFASRNLKSMLMFSTVVVEEIGEVNYGDD